MVSPSVNEKEKLYKAIENARGKILRLLNDEMVTNKTEDNTDAYSINQVLIEFDPNTKLNAGIIEKLTVSISKNQQQGMPDKISFDNNYDEKENDLKKILRDIVSRAKKDALEKAKINGTYKFSFSYEKKDFLYTGTSQGLAAAALAYNSILRIQMYKYYYKFKNDAVFGSAIDADGFLIPLEYDALKMKLKTVFYSPYKKYIIPEQNIIEARKFLEELNFKYPRRMLELIPIKHYMSLFKNLDVVEICKLKLMEKVKVHYNRYHVIANSVLSLIILVILSILIFNVIIPALDHNPVYAKYEMGRYIAYNKYDKQVWESAILTADELPPNDISTRIIITDLDNDGKNEILLLRNDNKIPLLAKTLFCYNADNSIKWKTIIAPKDTLYGNDVCYDNITLRKIFVVNNPLTKSKEILVDYIVCDLFPWFLAKLNYQGKEISTFYNSGNAEFDRIMDLDNDGKDEIIIAGHNNDFNHRGCLIVLDPEFVQGKSPGYRFPRGFGNGLMKYYILFPKIFLNKFSDQQASYIDAVNKFYDKIRVFLTETFGPVKERSSYRTIFNFDYQFNFLYLQTSTEFDRFYKRLIDEGKIQPIKNWKAYGDSLRKQILFWDGDKFVNHPVMNKYYLIAKASYREGTRK